MKGEVLAVIFVRFAATWARYHFLACHISPFCGLFADHFIKLKFDTGAAVLTDYAPSFKFHVE